MLPHDKDAVLWRSVKPTDDSFLRSAKTRVKAQLKDLFWCLYGASLQNPTLPADPSSLLFVCKGNICRSPFAEKLAIEMIGSHRENLSILSAGTEAQEGGLCPENAVIAAGEFGVDLKEHRSTRTTAGMMEDADIVFAMDASHFRTLRLRYPAYKNKVFLLPLFLPRTETGNRHVLKYNILDPFGRGTNEFRLSYSAIQRSLLQLPVLRLS